MAVLEKIRVKFGILIAVLVAIALLSFILDPQTLRSAVAMLSSENKVGEMNGEAISYKDFYEEFDNYQKIAEIMGQQVNDEKAQSSLRDAAWQSIFDKEVFIPKANQAGVFVGDEELMDLTQGANISPVLMNQAMFVDKEGNFSREALASFVQSIDSDETGRSAKYWNFLEESIVRNQYYSKYMSLIEKSAIVTEVEKEQMLSAGNVISDVDYVLSPLGFARDSSIQVSSAEIRDFYNLHKEETKQPANRDIEYVMFEVVPSASDKEETKAAFDELYAQFAEADNLRNFVTLNSDGKWDSVYYGEEQLASVPQFKEFAFGGSKDAVSPVVEGENSFSAVRVADVKAMSDSAHVYYKAFALTDGASADSLAGVLKSKPSTAELNELGWATQEGLIANGLSEMIPVLYQKEKVSTVKIPNAQAIFVLYTPERSKEVKKVQLATLLKNVLPSEETYRDFQMKATELADVSAGKYEKFAEYTKEKELPVVPAQGLVEASRRIGAVENAREVVRWTFDKKTKEGSVSDVITVDNKYYFVAAVTKARKEGYTDIKDLSAQISDLLYTKKAVAKKAEEIQGKIAGMTSLEQIAETLGTTVSHASGLSFGSIQNTGIEPKLIGAASVAEQGAIKVLDGEIGVYVFQVVNRENGSFFTDADVKTAAQRNGSIQAQATQAVIAKEADIKDNRARFF